MKSKSSGFTLIELLIAVAIVAILAAIAYPAYQNYIMRTRRADGKELAMRIASSEERYFTNFNKYGTLTDLNQPATSEKQYYTAAVVPGNGGQTYVITVTPAAGTPQTRDSCGALTINNTGYKDAPSDTHANGACW